MPDETLHLLKQMLTHEPYFHVKHVGDGFETRGTTSGLLGHEIQGLGPRTGEGLFAKWEWDGGALHVQVDECGFYPLYYYATDTECAISPSIPMLLLLGAPSSLDYPALSVFMRIGWFLGADTPYKAIRAFLPGGNLTWSPKRISVTGAVPLGKASHLSRSEGIDGYIELFRSALRRRLPTDDDFTVLLTGGRDSRHQLYELCLAGHKPNTAYTIGEYIVASNDEMVAAAAVAQATQVRHVIINQTESPLALEIRNNLATNFCADEHSWLWPLADHLRGKFKTIYDGLGGSIFDRGFQLTETRLAHCEAGRLHELADDLMLKEDTLSMLSHTLKTQCPRELAIAHLTEELRIHINTPNPIDSFLFWTRTRRESVLSSYRVLDASHTVFCPFIDLPLVNHLASLPGRMMLDHDFHDETIHRGFPQYAHIPFGPKGGPLQMKWSQAWQLAAELSALLSTRPGSQFVRYSYLIPRMLRCLVDKNYSESILWIGLYSLYFLQLETLPEQLRQFSQENQLTPAPSTTRHSPQLINK
jgi:asparagine synthase (glutamine-hydrolysing)